MASVKALQLLSGRNVWQEMLINPRDHKAETAVRQHIPMIKFPIRHGNAHSAKPHSLSNSSTQNPGTSSPSTSLPTPRASGSAKTYRELPSRYRRKPIDQVEIDYIQRGGPE